MTVRELIKFQLTRLMRGVTSSVLRKFNQLCDISTHTPHARRDQTIAERQKDYGVFQLTRLMRGVTARSKHLCCNSKFQLTRLMRGVTCAILLPGSRTRTFQLTRLMRGVTFPQIRSN